MGEEDRTLSAVEPQRFYVVSRSWPLLLRLLIPVGLGAILYGETALLRLTPLAPLSKGLMITLLAADVILFLGQIAMLLLLGRLYAVFDGEEIAFYFGKKTQRIAISSVKRVQVVKRKRATRLLTFEREEGNLQLIVGSLALGPMPKFDAFLDELYKRYIDVEFIEDRRSLRSLVQAAAKQPRSEETEVDQKS